MMDEMQQLENFICNNTDLVTLEKKFEKFNIFDCLRLTRAEIRHSNFLGWLLNPQETHGLNDYFLKEFLKTILTEKKRIENAPSVFDIDIWDMTGVEVKREYEYIDLLIIDENNKFVFMIENKIDTCQHDNQLNKYACTVDRDYPDYKKLYIYLKPEFEEVEKPFFFVSYKFVLDTINKLIDYKRDKMNEEIIMAIRHYKEIIERDIMDKSDMKKICRSIYKNHKKAIDLINKYNSDLSDDVMFNLKIMTTENSEIINSGGRTKIDFLPKGVNNLEKLRYGKNADWLQGHIIGLYFEKGNMNVDFGISVQEAKTEHQKDRKDLLSSLEKEYESFKGKNEAWRWLPIESISLDEFCEFEDADEIKIYLDQKLAKHIEKFCKVLNSIKPAQ